MKDVMFNEESRRYFEPSLFAEVDFKTFQKQIFNKYKGKKSIEYNEVLGFVLQETDYLAKDLDKVLKNIGVTKINNLKQKYNPFLNFLSHNSNSLLLRESPTCNYGTTLLEMPITAKKPKINYKEFNLIDGKRRLLVSQINDGSIIKRFDKTPLPKRLTDVICPHFLELKWAYGCPYDCAWCYLKGTFRFHNGKILPGFKVKDLDKIRLHVEEFLDKVDEPEILNTGEIADSLMYENSATPFSKFIIPMFEKQKKHKVLFVTKSNNVKNLLDINPHKQVIISFSLNADKVAERWEKGAPSVTRRIAAAEKLIKAGYEVRIRIDPMVPILDWRKYYINLIDSIFAKFVPERITLGSLRGLQSTINGTRGKGKDDSWIKYLTESSNWGKKIDSNLRYRTYLVIIEYLKKRYNFTELALCKETKTIWQKLGMDYKKIRCNCVR